MLNLRESTNLNIDLLGNVRTVISDYKNPFTTTGSINSWTYLANVKNISNMYPYGKSYGTNATYDRTDDYRYGFNGMEKAKEVDENTLTTQYRNADLEFNNWWSRDPKESEAPSNSPYIMMGNNPIVLIDPNVDKEYATLASYRIQTKRLDLLAGDWLQNDRTIMSPKFQSAAWHNLMNQKPNEYTEINQRYAFYLWFQALSNKIGFETQWAGAAYNVAFDVEWLDTKTATLTGSSNEELAKFANEGNEAIFVDVFPKLRNLILGTPLKGEDARSWDFKALAEEQHLVQPLYDNLKPKNIDLLTELIYGNHWTSPVSNRFKFSKDFPKELNVFTVKGRWSFGIFNMDFNYKLFKIPEVSNYYKNGGSQKKSSGGGRKLDTPLAPASK